MVSMIKHLIIPSYSFNYSQLQPHLILTPFLPVSYGEVEGMTTRQLGGKNQEHGCVHVFDAGNNTAVLVVYVTCVCFSRI